MKGLGEIKLKRRDVLEVLPCCNLELEDTKNGNSPKYGMMDSEPGG